MTLAAHSRNSQEPQGSLLPLGLALAGKCVFDQPCVGAPVPCRTRRLSSGSGADGKDVNAAEPADPPTEMAGAARADGGPPEIAASAAAAEPRVSSAASAAAADSAAAAGGVVEQAVGSPAAGGAAGAGAGAGAAAGPAAAAGSGSEGACGAGGADTEGPAGHMVEAAASGSDDGEEGWSSEEGWSEGEFEFDEDGLEERLEALAARRQTELKAMSPGNKRILADLRAAAVEARMRRHAASDSDAKDTDEVRPGAATFAAPRSCAAGARQA